MGGIRYGDEGRERLSASGGAAGPNGPDSRAAAPAEREGHRVGQRLVVVEEVPVDRIGRLCNLSVAGPQVNLTAGAKGDG